MRSLVRPIAGLLCLSALLSSAVAVAQPKQRTIEAIAGKEWKHANTGVAMPARLGGFDRQYIRDLTENELDVFAQYHGDESQTRLTLYFYRAALNSVPLWFDTANHSLRNNSGFLASTTKHVSSTFAPAGQLNESGMMAVYETPGGNFKSTGVAMFPLNGWLVKVRFSSAELSASDMAAALQPILQEISWPEKVSSGPTAVAIQPCKNRLKLTQKVKRIKPSLTDALIGGLMGVSTEDDDAEKDQVAPVYCRDPQDFSPFIVYRADGSKKGYILPLGDAGRALSIYRNELSGLISGTSGKRYTPVNMQLDRNIVYPDLNKLPTPQLLMSAAGDNAAVSTVTTWPKGDSTVSIGVPAEENE